MRAASIVYFITSIDVETGQRYSIVVRRFRVSIIREGVTLVCRSMLISQLTITVCVLSASEIFALLDATNRDPCSPSELSPDVQFQRLQ